MTLTLKWERDVTEHGRTIHRAGSCSFVLEYLPTGVAKVYKFRYHNEDTTWPYANRKEVEVIDIDPTLPREGAEFGTHGQRQLVEQLALRVRLSRQWLAPPTSHHRRPGTCTSRGEARLRIRQREDD